MEGIDSYSRKQIKKILDEIINLERRVITLECIIETLHAPRNQPDPDCAVDPTGEWY